MTTTFEQRKRVRVLDLEVDLTDYPTVIDHIDRLARARDGGYICVANVHVAIEARDDAGFASMVNAADLVLPDGMPLVWMQKWQGNENAVQVRGPSLMPMLMKHAETERLNAGFLGGRPDVLERLIARASTDFPDLNVVYSYSPPFRELTSAEAREIENAINDSGVQILFVGLGCPKQERWMAASRSSINAVAIGVGAAFDLYAGNIREAPSWISKLGLEWVYRLLQEPRRLFSRYLLVNPRFVWLATKQIGRYRLRNHDS